MMLLQVFQVDDPRKIVEMQTLIILAPLAFDIYTQHWLEHTSRSSDRRDNFGVKRNSSDWKEKLLIPFVA
jgi:hypothetical protein